MNAHKLIFPGLIVGILWVVFFTNLLASHRGTGGSINATGNSDHVSVAAANKQSGQELAISANTTAGEACSLNPSYPQAILQWCHLIERYATDNGLDPNLVSAVMLQESAGKPDAYSKSGAVGLMQVMPRDGKAAGFMCKNGPCFSDRPSMNELFDPEYNVAYATRMLSELIASRGDVRDALRAYGPMDVGYYYADLVMGIMGRYRQQ